MRRLIAFTFTLLSIVAVSACGSSSTGHSASSPMAAALSYFPSDSPMVASVSTSPHGSSASQLQTLESSTPSATLIRAGLFQELASLGINYNRDVKPLLGNPIAFGIGSSEVGAGQTAFLAAWQTNSAPALKRLITSVHALSRSGTHDGATLYAGTGFAVAIDGAQLLAARNTAQLQAALDRHAADNGFTAADFGRDTTGLPAGAAFTVVGDLQTALSTPRAAQARRVPWVAALRGYGMTLTGAAHQLQAHFRVDSSGATLRSAQLPMAAGSASAGVAGILPISVGLRDPAQVYEFIKRTLQQADPAQYRRLLRGEAQTRRRSGIDVDALAGSLTGTAQVTSDGHTTIVCIPVSTSTGAQLQRVLEHPTAQGRRSVALGGGLYRLRGGGDSDELAGVLHGVLVIGNGSPAEVRGFARAPVSRLSGAQGALALRIAVGELITLSGRARTNPAIGQVAAMLGELTGSAQVTPQALTGTLSLAIK